ncbi:two-component system histidine kinase PnpS [Bacillus massiliglaciei]|uniref:two-component system histidine kinase PnpS n=1 Tax=Bacillus massiliglaciei TaxID=1816693 RepID=UPI000AE222B5|nr:ATP-binding protein [Bacillus massiliglaciei]
MMFFRRKYILALAALVIVVLVAAGLSLGQLFKETFFHTYNERIEKETAFISKYIEESGGIGGFLEQQKEQKLLPLIDSDLTILSADGDILFEYSNGKSKGQVLDPAIQRIITEEKGEHAAGTESVKDERQYFWKALKKDGQIEGYAVQSNDIAGYETLVKKMWKILFLILGLVFFILLFIGSRIASSYAKPIKTASETADELAKGNYRVRARGGKYPSEIGVLLHSLNTLARNLAKTDRERETNQDQLLTMIENIGSGVMLIDPKSEITLINREYRKLFSIKPENFVNKAYYDVIKQKEVISIIEEIFMTEKSIKRQVEIPVHLDTKHYEIYGAPIIGTYDDWKGIILIFHDITELKKLEQVRKDFVANVSHELKTPVTSIKGFSETLLDGAIHDEASARHFLSIILKETDRLQRLIQDLLNLSKMEQHEFTLKVSEVDILEILDDVQTMLSKKAEEKEITLTLDAPDELPIIEGDAERIKQIFLNLITNGLTYTPKHGQVTIRVREIAKCIQVEVEDNGPGIEESKLPRIFERFYRIDKARSRDSGGTGLGLSIVKHIVEVHNGDISVRSRVGEGTVFTVKLPKRHTGSK